MKENQQTISAWARKTFGTTSAQAIAKRMGLEYKELVEALDRLKFRTISAPEPETYGESVMTDAAIQRLEEDLRRAAVVECADIYIMLVQIVECLGEQDFFKVVDDKMVINRNRVWGRGEHGHQQHVETGFADTQPEVTLSLPGGVVEFKEPGSGIRMRTDRWYVVSDSGSAYLSSGFTDPENAKLWAQSPFVQREYGGRVELFMPRWDGPGVGYLDAFDAVNLVSGAHMLDFWKMNDPEYLREVNDGRLL